MVTFPSRSIRSVRLLSERGTLPAQSHKSLSLFPACSPPLLLLVQVAKCSLTHPSFLQIGGKSAFSVKLGGNCRRTNGLRCYLGRIGQRLARAPPSKEWLDFAFSRLYFAPQSAQHHFASENNLFWIPIFAGCPRH